MLYVELVMSIDRLIEAARTAAPKPDRWPAAAVLAHVADTDDQVWWPRIARMITDSPGDVPVTFGPWEPDPADVLRRHRDAAVDDAAARAMANRVALVTRLRDLSDVQWSSTAVQEGVGQIDVETMVYLVLAYDEQQRAALVLEGLSADGLQQGGEGADDRDRFLP